MYLDLYPLYSVSYVNADHGRCAYSPVLVPRAGTSLYSASLNADHGRCAYSPVLVPRAGTSFVQCFAWSAKRGQMCLVCPTPCAVCLGITGAEHTRPCWYLCWYIFRTVLRLVSPQAMYHLPGLVLVLVSQTRANLPSLPYPLRSSLGYHGR